MPGPACREKKPRCQSPPRGALGAAGVHFPTEPRLQGGLRVLGPQRPATPLPADIQVQGITTSPARGQAGPSPGNSIRRFLDGREISAPMPCRSHPPPIHLPQAGHRVPSHPPPRGLHCRPNIPPPPAGAFSPQPKSTHAQAQPDQPQSNRPPLVSSSETAGAAAHSAAQRPRMVSLKLLPPAPQPPAPIV